MASTRPAPESSDDSITQLLGQLGQGNREAESKLIRQVYGELRKIAGRQMRNERASHTLQPTALVNEAYLRLVKQPIEWRSRAHFFAIASQVMRRVLVDYGRARKAEKRGGNTGLVTLDHEVAAVETPLIDVLELDELLDRLALLDPKLARLLEMHFFGGLSQEEIAEAMHVSTKTVKRWWTKARSWLRSRLQP